MRNFLFLIISLLFVPLAMAQQIEPGLVGTDFWLTFLRNGNANSQLDYSLFIASEYGCTAHVEAPLLGWDTTVFVPADTSIRVFVPDSCTPQSAVGVLPCGLHVATSEPALVYASNHGNQTADMTSVMPTSVLRTSYMTQTYGGGVPGQQVAVVALYDSTLLHVVFAESVYTGSNYWSPAYSAGDTLDLVLMRGMVYLLNTGNIYDSNLPKPGFSGTRFIASKPVSVFQGHRCTNVPDYSSSCDHLYTQTLPADLLGCHYLLVPTSGRVPNPPEIYYHDYVGDLVKVTARDDNCTVFVNNQPVTQLNAGESYTFVITNHYPDYFPSDMDLYQCEALPLSTSSPTLVCFYISSSGYGGRPGDPAVVVVPPLEQGISRTIVPVYNTTLVSSHYVNVVSPATDVGGITLDGVNIAAAFSQNIAGYCYARLTLNEGVHVLDADTGRFLATFYGLGYVESYAYVAAMSARSAEYNVYVDTYTPCLDDTVTITFSSADSTLGVEWHVDGQMLAFGGDTLRISFDSVGLHRIAVVVTPVCDTVWEYINVLAPFAVVETDTILQGQIYDWHGFSLTETGIYHDTVASANGCDSVFTINLLVIGNTPLQITADDYEEGICLGDTVRLTASPDTALVHWTSTPYDPSLDSQFTFHTVVVSPEVTTTYTLLENLPDGPSFTVQVASPEDLCLQVNTPVIVAFDDRCVSVDNCSPEATSSLWTLSDGRHFEGHQLFCYLQDSSVDSLTVELHTCWLGCCKDTTLTLPVVQISWKFPNVITPNGDGINDYFAIENLDVIAYPEGAVNRLQVFDRWGKMVYDAENYDTYASDGMVYRGNRCFDGDGLSEGVYFYSFEYKGTARTLRFNGSITIVR